MRSRSSGVMLAAVLAIAGWTTALNFGVHIWFAKNSAPATPPIIVQAPQPVFSPPRESVDLAAHEQSVASASSARTNRTMPTDRGLSQSRDASGDRDGRRQRPPRAVRRNRDDASPAAATAVAAASSETREVISTGESANNGADRKVLPALAVEDTHESETTMSLRETAAEFTSNRGESAVDQRIDWQPAAAMRPIVTSSRPAGQERDGPDAAGQTPGTQPGGESPADQTPPRTAEPPISAPSPLLGQLGRAQERAAQSAAPAASGVDAATTRTSAVDTTQLARASSAAASVSGVRRSPISIQPVIRGYQQHQIYGQYQGANFVPVRFDFDSILSNVDPGLIDNLIIITGPYGVRYGPGLAFVDVVAAPTPRYECPEFHSRTNLLYQTNGEQFYGRETVYGGGPDFGIRASYGHKVGSDYESGDGTNIPGSYNVRDVDIAVGLDLSENSKFEIEYLSQDLTDTEFAGLFFDADFRKTDAVFLRFTCDDPCSDVRWLVEAWYNRTIFQGDNLNRSKQYFYRNNLYFNAQGASFFPDVAFVGFTDAAVTNSGFRAAGTWGGDDELQFTAGVDFHYVQQRLDEFDDFTDNTLQFSPVGFDNFPVLPSESVDPGLFVETKLPVDEKLKLAAGARVDWVTTRADGRHRATAPDGGRPLIFGLDELPKDNFEEVFGTGLTKHDVLAAAFVSADYAIDPCLNVRLGFGHGQRPPSLTERYAFLPFLTIIQNAGNAPLGDPNLDPEKASQFDLALIGNYEQTRFRVAGFCSLIEDFITYDFFFFPTTPDVETLVFKNTRATLAGFEASGEHDLTCHLTPFFNMSYVDGRDQDRDTPLPSIFPFQTRVGIRWHDPENKLFGIEFAARIVANQDRIASDLFEEPTPGFTIYDLRAWWQVNPHLRLTTGIDNLSDKNYLEHLSVHDPRVLEPGINFFAALELDY